MANSSHLEFLDILLREADLYQQTDPNLAALLRTAESRLRLPTEESWILANVDISDFYISKVATWLEQTGKKWMAPSALPNVGIMLRQLNRELEQHRNQQRVLDELWWQ
jgi:hypothetical protein